MNDVAAESGTVALLIVDMTLGFTDPKSPLGCDAEAAVEAIAELLTAARTHRVPIAYTRVAYQDPVSPGGRLFRMLVPQLADLVDGRRATLIDPRIEPADDDLVLRKECASAFWGTTLSAWIAAHGIDSLVLTGASTSGCVRATVVDAMQHGLQVFVPTTAVADRDPASHHQTLSDIAWRYAWVVSQSEALKLLCAPSMNLPAAATALEPTTREKQDGSNY